MLLDYGNDSDLKFLENMDNSSLLSIRSSDEAVRTWIFWTAKKAKAPPKKVISRKNREWPARMVGIKTEVLTLIALVLKIRRYVMLDTVYLPWHKIDKLMREIQKVRRRNFLLNNLI